MNIARAEWEWMPHPGHFIASDRCLFRLATRVGPVIVSTVGEYRPVNSKEGFVSIGCGRLYETMVFKAIRDKGSCCEWKIDVSEELDATGYNDAVKAREGHMALCLKWSDRG